MGSEAVNYVPRHFEMDSEVEVFLPTGRRLKKGMKILIEALWLRRDLDKYARWIEVVSEPEFAREVVEFVGLYEDGTKRRFMLGTAYGWFVKKDSIPLKEA